MPSASAIGRLRTSTSPPRASAIKIWWAAAPSVAVFARCASSSHAPCLRSPPRAGRCRRGAPRNAPTAITWRLPVSTTNGRVASLRHPNQRHAAAQFDQPPVARQLQRRCGLSLLDSAAREPSAQRIAACTYPACSGWAGGVDMVSRCAMARPANVGREATIDSTANAVCRQRDAPPRARCQLPGRRRSGASAIDCGAPGFAQVGAHRPRRAAVAVCHFQSCACWPANRSAFCPEACSNGRRRRCHRCAVSASSQSGERRRATALLSACRPVGCGVLDQSRLLASRRLFAGAGGQ